jgi:replicative DNA helicase
MTALMDAQIPQQFDRLPPHSIEAEMCVVASLMLAGDQRRMIFASVRSLIDRECFYQADHQIIFDVLCDLDKRGLAIDAVMVRDSLSKLGMLEEVGGTVYLAQIINTVPSAAHAAHYAAIVKEKFLLRRLISLSNDALRSCHAPATGDVAEGLLIDLATKASRLAAGAKANEVCLLNGAIELVLNRAATGIKRFIPTGLDSLDRIIGGLPVGGKLIFGSMPGMGKSAIIKQILRILAERMPVGLITVEEQREKVAENILSNESGVPNNRIAYDTADQTQWNEMVAAAARLDAMPFYIVDTARKLSSILAMANVLACQYGCKVIAVDHIHIVGNETKDLNREQQISEISRELKWAWKELNVAGIEAAQLNRKAGRDRPTIDSLRDSGSLGQDGDTIIMLYREDYFRKQSGNEPLDNVLEAIVVKNKSGAAATVPLCFDEARQRVSDPSLQNSYTGGF